MQDGVHAGQELQDRRRQLPHAVGNMRVGDDAQAHHEQARPPAGLVAPARQVRLGIGQLRFAGGMMLTAQALYSGILAVGSSASMVSRLAAASAKCMGINTTPGWVLGEMFTRSTTVPRRDVTRATSPVRSPQRSASTSWMSISASG